MSKVVIDLTMSLDGFIAGPNDARGRPLGERGGEHLFDWYRSGTEPVAGDAARFTPEGANRPVVEAMFETMGAMLTGRRTYEISGGWNGTHPVNGIPVFILTHDPPTDPPRGKSELVFVTDGVERAVARAKAAAGGKYVGIGGASAAQQALAAGLVDEIFVHVAPMILGDGVRLFDHLSAAVRLQPVEIVAAPHATHRRYRVLKAAWPLR